MSLQACAAIQLLQRGHDGCAVVRGKNDEGVLAEVQGFEGSQEPAYVIVHVGDQSGIALGVH